MARDRHLPAHQEDDETRERRSGRRSRVRSHGSARFGRVIATADAYSDCAERTISRPRSRTLPCRGSTGPPSGSHPGLRQQVDRHCPWSAQWDRLSRRFPARSPQLPYPYRRGLCPSLRHRVCRRRRLFRHPPELRARRCRRPFQFRCWGPRPSSRSCPHQYQCRYQRQRPSQYQRRRHRMSRSPMLRPHRQRLRRCPARRCPAPSRCRPSHRRHRPARRRAPAPDR